MYEEVLRFWFEFLKPNDWFNGGDEVDQIIRERFEDWIEPVYRGECDGWLEAPRGRLAAIITLDQFPRNVFRGTSRSFAYDDRALQLSREGVELEIDLELEPHECAFFYLPLEHSEEMQDQDRSMERFSHLVTRVEPDNRKTYREYLRYAWRHYEIVRRFGRYPHRNDILGRESSAAEAKFLTQPGSSFL